TITISIWANECLVLAASRCSCGLLLVEWNVDLKSSTIRSTTSFSHTTLPIATLTNAAIQDQQFIAGANMVCEDVVSESFSCCFCRSEMSR
uniref:Tyrosine-protein phosphatase domain-containing protein n=1 Tax=Parascaris univalens TaxID=6257 RepID=A0A915A2V4_PARUN